MRHFFKKIKSPVGELTLVANDQYLIAVLWEIDKIESKESRVRLPAMELGKNHPILRQTETQLKEYFSGQRRNFELPLQFFSGTEFQTSVWRALQKIPFGKTRNYGQLAKTIARPLACRAVGAANGKNPISIIVPCHRVIGADGSLTGFAGGMKAKEFLIEFEKNRLALAS